jgi:hypothetical protein
VAWGTASGGAVRKRQKVFVMVVGFSACFAFELAFSLIQKKEFSADSVFIPWISMMAIVSYWRTM